MSVLDPADRCSDYTYHYTIYQFVRAAILPQWYVGAHIIVIQSQFICPDTEGQGD